MNFLIYFFYLGILISSSLHSETGGAEGLKIRLWHKAFGPGFEIQNKGTDIWVAVGLDGSFKEFFKLAKNARKSMEITGDEDILLGVYDKEPTVNPRGLVGSVFAGSAPTYKYNINAQGKTKYLTWNPAKFNTAAKYFYPQTGKFGGLLGTSESGNSLEKNITQSDIKMK